MNLSPLTPLAAPSFASELPRDLEQACRGLEEAFAQLVFSKMRQAITPKGALGSSFAQQTALGMLDAQWAHLASQGEGLGLWRALYRQLAPSMIKSGEAGTEERSGGGTFSRQAVHVDAKRGPGALGHRLGYPQALRTPPLDAGVSGVPEQAEQRLGLYGAGIGSAGRKGK
ncbi:MAG: rod-binding protein [Deltaproteobacteria bacterium]|nr:rod-binding protein [Deltaproteobacteria bacterium]